MSTSGIKEEVTDQKAIVVADKFNNDTYQYLLDNKKWVKLNEFPESVDKICGFFEINDVFYIVGNKGISALNENIFKLLFKKHYAWCTSCQVGNKILVVFSNYCEYVKSILFDPVKKQWSDVNIKTERKGFDVVEFRNQVLIVGGLGYDEDGNYEYLNTIQVYDPIKKVTFLSSIKMIQHRYHHKVIVYNNSIFVFGGCNVYDKPLNSVEMCSQRTKKFVMMAPMKTARSSFACCRVENLVYCIGGWNSGGFTNVVEVYNLDTNQWCYGTSFPVIAASNLHACAVNNKLE